MPVFPWVRKRLLAWAAGETGKGIIAAPEKGNDFVPPCEIVLPEDAKAARARVCMAVNVVYDIAPSACWPLAVCQSFLVGTIRSFTFDSNQLPLWSELAGDWKLLKTLRLLCLAWKS